MKSMRPALRFLPFLLVSLVVGCKSSGPTVPTAPDGSYIGGRQLDSPARYIVSLSPSATEVLAINGASRLLIGRTESCNYPPFVHKIPVVMSGTKPNYERIMKLLVDESKKPVKPDLFVYDPALFSDSDVAMMAQYSRIKPFPLGGDTIDEFIKNLRDLSTYYTGETYMSDYIDKIVTARNLAQADPVTPKPKVAVILPGKGSEHMIAGKDSFYADEVRAATGDPVGPPGNKFYTLNAEALLQWNPDVVVTAGDASSFENDPRFTQLAAVKNHHIIAASEDAIERRGVRVPDVISQLHNTMAGMMHGVTK